jgi:DNA-binding protein H-NS
VREITIMPASTKPSIDDFKDLPLEEIEEMQSKLQSFVSKQKDKKKREALNQIKQLVQQHELSFEEVTQFIRTAAKRGKAPAIYQNPAKPRQTWSGKGEPPQWFVEASDKEALRIPGA